jgi:hypothetical protein
MKSVRAIIETSDHETVKAAVRKNIHSKISKDIDKNVERIWSLHMAIYDVIYWGMRNWGVEKR